MKTVTVTKITPAFTDKRGDISDILDTEIHSTGIITFTPGAVRGNHYHKIQTQYTYMLTGRSELHFRPADTPDAPVEMVMLETGDLASIPAGIIHTYRAPEAASMLCLTDLSRHGTGYENDTYRVEILKPSISIEELEDIVDMKAIEERKNDETISWDEFFSKSKKSQNR